MRNANRGNQHHSFIFALGLAVIFALVVPKTARANNDPSQFIGYWQNRVVAADANEQTQLAHQVFDRLLQAWDLSRVEPNLHVVKAAGPWAASLADGNILITEQALDFALQGDSVAGKHQLAFILAHELAHQRSEDLWHLRFHRLIGNQSPETQSQVLEGLSTNPKEIEKAEAQADQQAVVLMAAVGYAPGVILAGGPTQKDFFTRWVENIWQFHCADQASSPCQQAQLRALRTRSQLQAIAAHSALYELGIQAMVAADYDLARRYFVAYGRNFPGRAVHSAIGLSYLAEALTARNQLAQELQWPLLYFPLMMDDSPGWVHTAKRGISPGQKQINQLTDKAIGYLSRAKTLAPNHRLTYVHMAMAYLLSGNAPMAEGIVRGEYVRRFGQDSTSDLLLAISLITQEQTTLGEKLLVSLTAQPIPAPGSPLPQRAEQNRAIHFAAVANLAHLYRHTDRDEQARKLWYQYTRNLQGADDGLRFQLALQQLKPNQAMARGLSSPQLQGVMLGTKTSTSGTFQELWFEGEMLTHMQLKPGLEAVKNPKGTILAVWQREIPQSQAADAQGQNPGQQSSTKPTIFGIQLGDLADRAVKTLGAPDRRITLVSGQYLAYDRVGLALKTDEKRIVGWFLFHPKSKDL